ncbi:zinc-binding dehydrogenase [Jannaschia helgolandensis]|uniref:zinc-binding dehydrogenase n=1 Tax=Jannaschia helgolandensis TaxID=188906 RepID=UPI0030DB0B37|tara:strand:- start:1180 stop:2271 length:1092 start_codon:yes stop_codon:yes gene_type:complete
MSVLPMTMSGWVLTGHGGPEVLEWRTDLPVPVAGPGEVLIAVRASSVNNTDINTRIGWYSKSVRGATDGNAVGDDAGDGGWNGALSFPRIQGADCCGIVVATGPGVETGRVGERVVTRAMHRVENGGPFDIATLGSERDGGFAEYMTARAADACAVHADAITDAELGALPCAYSTAEGMLDRVSLSAERVLITGASGGVGLAAVQLARLRGAEVTAIAGGDKGAAVAKAGAQHVIGRDDPLPDGFDVVVDLVAGPRWPDMLAALRRGGRYVTSGAIAGPIVELDIRDLYLRDLTLMGSTAQPDHIIPTLIAHMEAGRLHPVIAASYDLRDMAAAQAAFTAKQHVGKIALRVATGERGTGQSGG